MAEIPVYEAFVTVKDSAKKSSTVTLRVDATDGKAYVAAADAAARAATKVGLLLAAVEPFMLSEGNLFDKGVKSSFRNDAWTQPAADLEYLNSNKLNIAYQTLNGGLPERLGFSIPQRNTAAYSMETNGVNVNISTGATTEVENLIAQIADTLVSKFGTACNVLEITINDQ